MHLGSAALKRVDSEVDLGITLTSNLCWNMHISKIVSKANKMLGVLRRTRHLLTLCDVRRTLYLSLVKPNYVAQPNYGRRPSLSTKHNWRVFKGAPQDGFSNRETLHIKTVCRC